MQGAFLMGLGISIAFFVIGFGCFRLGWLYAHETVAKECKKLGKFYVGDEVFECTLIVKKDNLSADDKALKRIEESHKA